MEFIYKPVGKFKNSQIYITYCHNKYHSFDLLAENYISNFTKISSPFFWYPGGGERKDYMFLQQVSKLHKPTEIVS